MNNVKAITELDNACTYAQRIVGPATIDEEWQSVHGLCNQLLTAINSVRATKGRNDDSPLLGCASHAFELLGKNPEGTRNSWERFNDLGSKLRMMSSTVHSIRILLTEYANMKPESDDELDSHFAQTLVSKKDVDTTSSSVPRIWRETMLSLSGRGFTMEQWNPGVHIPKLTKRSSSTYPLPDARVVFDSMDPGSNVLGFYAGERDPRTSPPKLVIHNVGFIGSGMRKEIRALGLATCFLERMAADKVAIELSAPKKTS